MLLLISLYNHFLACNLYFINYFILTKHTNYSNSVAMLTYLLVSHCFITIMFLYEYYLATIIFIPFYSFFFNSARSIIDTFMGLDAVILWTPTFWREWLTIIVSILRINAFITVKTQKELENTKTIRFSHKIYTEHTKIKLKVNKFFFYIVINSIISTKHILLVNLATSAMLFSFCNNWLY